MQIPLRPSVEDLAGVRKRDEIENGRNLPTFRTIRRLSEALGVAPAEIAEFAAAIEERGKDAA